MPRKRKPGRPPKPSGVAGRKLYRARRALGLTQAQLAARLGIHQNTWGRWERGDHEPDALKLRLMLKELGA